MSDINMAKLLSTQMEAIASIRYDIGKAAYKIASVIATRPDADKETIQLCTELQRLAAKMIQDSGTRLVEDLNHERNDVNDSN